MPIPDTIAPNDDYQEAQAAEIAKAQAKTKAIIDTCNALLRKQGDCGEFCSGCEKECEEHKTWMELEKE